MESENLSSFTITMKMFLLLVCSLILTTGCATPGGAVAIGNFKLLNPNTGFSPVDPFLQSRLPADPVRKSYSYFRNLDGSYSYHHSQGTDNSVSRSWDAYGPREDVRQSTYNNTSESFTPAPRYIAPTRNVYPVVPGQQPYCPPNKIEVRPWPGK